MKISQTNNSLSFCKTLVGTCKLPRTQSFPMSCKIFKLDPKEDKGYFSKLFNKNAWQDGTYIWSMETEFTQSYDGDETFVMENRFGKCLGYINISSCYAPKTQREIVFLETCPEYQSTQEKRPVKYIGETLLAFVVKRAQESGVNCVCIPHWAKTAKDFYKNNCGFNEANKVLYIVDRQFDGFIEKNKKHSMLNINV